MPQKILAGRANDPQLRGDLVLVKVDQVILSRAPTRALGEALALGLRRAVVETAVAYEGTCVTDAASLAAADARSPLSVAPELPQYNVYVARAGMGFPGPVHLERFASPARLAITDDPRLATVGGIGMLTLVVSSRQLGQALVTGSLWVRPPRSVQILLSGKLRPFVCARDVALELLRRGAEDAIRRIEAQHHAPVILEFAGPSARLLSVPERAVLCGIAPQIGAAGALFVSDEKTEVFLRDQRRSKAHRTLSPDPGAPCDEVISIDLATVDPLLLDESGQVRPVRDLSGTPVWQVVLGGDSGATLRDLLAAAMLLKSKRVPAHTDLLIAPPSRQCLEVLAQSGALVDLVATGARVLEPDRRLLTLEIYPPAARRASLRTSDPQPRVEGSPRFIVASAETLAYAVATGAVGDPRSFKRPVRVTVPRTLPTDDVLLVRDRKAAEVDGPRRPLPGASPSHPWSEATTLTVLEGVPRVLGPVKESAANGCALVLSSLDEVRAVAETPGELDGVRAVVASFVPSAAVAALASEGIASFSVDASAVDRLRAEKSLALPAPGSWGDEVPATVGKERVPLNWLAQGPERAWTHQGAASAVIPSAKRPS